MNSRSVKAMRSLLWKEIQIVLPFAISLTLLGVVLQLLIVLSGNVRVDHWMMEFLVTVLPMLILIGSVATGFAAEHENETFLGQRLLPAEPLQIFASKLVVPFVAAIIAFCVLSVAASTFAEGSITGYRFTRPLLVALEMLVWCTLLSMVMRQPIHALAVGAALAGLSGFAILQFATPNFSFGAEASTLEITLRLAFSVAIMTLNLTLVGPWFNDQLTQHAKALLRGLPSRNRRNFAGEGSSAGRARVFVRLQWVLIHTRLIPLGLIFCVSIGLLIWPVSPSGTVSGSIMLLVMCCGLIGGLTFSEPAKHTLVMTYHGISARQYWFYRLAIPLVAVVVIFVASWIAIEAIERQNEFLVALLPSLFAAFAIGQWISMSCRRVLVTVGLCLIASFAVLFLAVLASEGTLPIWLTLLPACTIPLAVTYIRKDHWVRDLCDASARRFLALTFLVPAFAWIFAVGTYRVLSIPAVPQTAEIKLLEAADKVKVQRTREVIDPSVLYGGNTSTREIQWAATSVADALLADELDMTAADVVRDDSYADGKLQYGDTRRLLSVSTVLGEGLWHAINQGESQTAKRLILADIKHARILRRTLAEHYGTFGCQVHLLAQWAAMPQISADDIQLVIDRLGDAKPTRETLAEFASALATHADRIANDRSDPNYLGELSYSLTETTLQARRFLFSVFFWEKLRFRRYMAALQADSMTLAQATAESLELGRPISQNVRELMLLPESERPLPRSPHFYQSALSQAFLNHAIHVRLARLGLSLIAYQKEHGELPRSLDEVALKLGEKEILNPDTLEPHLYLPDGVPSTWIEEGRRKSLSIGTAEIQLTAPFVCAPSISTGNAKLADNMMLREHIVPKLSDFRATWLSAPRIMPLTERSQDSKDE